MSKVRLDVEQGNDVGARLAYLLSTGNLQSRSGLDMSQNTGFTIVAERLNFVRCFPSALACLDPVQ